MQNLLTPERQSIAQSIAVPPTDEMVVIALETPDTSMLGAAEPLWIAFRGRPGDEILRNQLIEFYMPLVRSRGERIWARLPDGIELDDLISAGTFGLMDAIGAFDLAREVKFETFCMPRIQGAMLDELRKMDWVPRQVRSKASKINEAYKRLEGELGRKPADFEVAKFLDVPVEDYQRMLAETHSVNMSSLDKKWGETDSMKDVREVEILADKRGEDPTERLRKIDMLRGHMKGLTKNERLILILYYYEEMTMKEIGATLDLSESRVSQMHSAIVDRIKKMSQERE